MSTEGNTQADAQPAPSSETTKNLRYEIDWRYTPPDFFSSAISERVLDCELKIDKGTALAQIDAVIYEKTPSYHRQIHRLLDARFKVQEFKTAKPYTLDDGTLTEFHHNGKRTKHLSMVVSSKIGISSDLRITDSSGKVLFDSSAERARGKFQHQHNRTMLKDLDEQLETAIGQYYQRDQQAEPLLVASLLSSYLAACNDPEDELVYLYELRDALAKRFGGEIPTRQALAVSKAEWSDFGRLSNDEPVSQGRHRGKFPGELRSATEEELVKARLFAKRLLLQFLLHLNPPKATTR